jgi:hypothetical protein
MRERWLALIFLGPGLIQIKDGRRHCPNIA